MRFRASIALALTALCLGSAAQPRAEEAVSINAEIDSPVLYEGESFNLSISVEGPMRGIGTPEIPELSDFSLLGTSSSTNFSFINGRATSAKVFRYTLIPVRSGGLEIPEIPIKIKNETYRTKAIRVAVKPAQRSRSQGSGAGVQPAPNSPPTSEQSASEESADAGNRNVFIRSWTDKQKIYVGEQLTHHFGLFRNPQVRFLSTPQYTKPETTGFWAENLGDEISGYSTIDGQSYAATELRMALFPNEPGKLTIGPAAVRVRLRDQRRFELFTFDTGPEKHLRTPPIEVEVLPLPAAGRPADFRGTVAGDLRIQAKADGGPYEVGAPITVRIELSATGNPRAFAEPKLEPGDDFKQYESDLQSETNIDQDRIRVRKIFSQVIVPRREGTLKLPGARYSWFDPKLGEYRSTSTEDFTFQVAPSRSEERQPVVFSDLNPERVEMLGRSIHHLKTVPLLAQDGKRFPRSRGFWTALGLPWPLLAGAWIWSRRRERLLSDEAGHRARGARRSASRHLKSASQARERGDFDGFCTDLAAGLRGYLADRMNSSAAGLTQDRVEEGLTALGASGPLSEKTLKLLSDCDYARYAPGSERATRMDALLDRAEECIRDLDGEIGRTTRRGPILPLGVLALGLVIASPAFVARAQETIPSEARMDEAAARYEKGDFIAATKIWEELAEAGVEDSHLWYNLGNAYFQQEELGLSILSYRRALRLAPRDTEIRDNLELARSRQQGGETEAEPGGPAKAWNWLCLQVSPGEFAAAGLGLLWVGAILSLLVILKKLSWRRARATLIPIFVLLPLVSIAAWLSEYQDWSGREAVLLAPLVEVQSGPGEDYITLFEIHEGAEFRLEETRGAWIRISLGKDLGGWIPLAAAGTL